MIHSYSDFNPHIILVNSHGLKSNESLKIPGYHVHKVNSSNDVNDGSAIAIKRNMEYKLDDSFDTDFLSVEIDTSLGKIVISTTYLPPRRAFLPFTDLHKLLSNSKPTSILGDFNARHRTLGNSNNNVVGQSLHRLISQGRLVHLGPTFPTLPRHTSATTPDIVLTNKWNHFNTHLASPHQITSPFN